MFKSYIFSLRRRVKLLVAGLVLLGLPVLAAHIYLEEQGNFHVVEPGLIYRSARMDEDELVRYFRSCGIKTILNLEGERTDREWYREEGRVAAKYGVTRIDYSLNARKFVPPWKLKELVSIIAQAPKPLLIRCKSGADRTGLAASLWHLDGLGLAPDIACKQLSLAFGHFPWYNKTVLMDDSFWNYVRYEELGAEILPLGPSLEPKGDPKAALQTSPAS